MNIGIIGSGRIGATVATLCARAGHHVAISNSGGPETLSSLVSSLGSNVTAKTVEEAVDFGEIVLIAIPWVKRASLPGAHLFDKKIVIDATNHYIQGGVAELGESTSSEEMLKHMPGARLVKAFNTMYFETLRTEARPNARLEDRLVLFVASDDSQAKEIVARFIEDLGFATVDTGFLKEGGRLQQPGSPIYNVPMEFEEAKRRLTALP